MASAVSAHVFYIPSGTKNLSGLFPDMDWNDVDEYYVEVMDEQNNVIATTPTHKICCLPDQYVRLHFLNYLGAFDALNFLKPSVSHEATDSTFQRSPGYPLSKTDTGLERFNVRSNDTYQAKQICYAEEHQNWLQELFDSVKVLMEWQGKEGQPDDFLPVIILDAKFDKLKNIDEFRYELPVKFKLANEFITIRN